MIRRPFGNTKQHGLNIQEVSNIQHVMNPKQTELLRSDILKSSLRVTSIQDIDWYVPGTRMK